MSKYITRVAAFGLSLLAFSGTLHAQCVDYFSKEWNEPLDMNGEGDLLNNITPIETHEVSGYSYSNGEVSFTATGNDPYFLILTKAVPGSIPNDTTRYGDVHPVDTGFYKYLSIRMNSDRNGDMQILWQKTGSNFAITQPITTQAGWKTYTIDLSAQPISDSIGSSAWTNGASYGLRIDPIRNAVGATIKIDWIQLTNTPCDFGQAPYVKFVQPDKEGGEDYFTAVRNNPENFDSPADIAYLHGQSSANIYPGNVYTDSAGAVRSGDYLEAINKQGEGDVSMGLVSNDNTLRIDPLRYKIACFTMDVLKPTNVYHSVARLFWGKGVNTYTGDDILLKTTGEARYCLRMDTISTEPAVAPGAQHPWSRNADGTGLHSLRLDPHEESDATKFRINDFRLAAEHEADSYFTVVVDGSRDKTVSLFYKAEGGANTTFTTLSAGRSSDVAIWNTSALPAGTYQIGAVVDSVTFTAPGSVVVNHGPPATDTTLPILHMDAPLDGHKFDGSIEVAGYSIDNRRIAAIEFFLNNQFIGRTQPSQFNLTARNLYSTLPYASTAGFQMDLSTQSLAAGAYTFKAKAYDTAGNVTEFSSTVTKESGGSTPHVSYPVPNESPMFVSGSPTPPSGGGGGGGGGGGQTPRPSLALSAKAGTVNFTVSNVSQCSQVRLFVNSKGPAATTVLRGKSIATISPAGAERILASSTNVLGSKRRSRRLSVRAGASVYILADCGSGSKNIVKSVSLSRLAKRGYNAPTASQAVSKIVKNFQVK